MICRFCGKEGAGVPFDKWVKPTFTDHDKLLDGEIVCSGCLFWFEQKSEQLTKAVGKWWPTADDAPEADRNRLQAVWGGYAIPQRMQNYSHFIVSGQWTPLSKGDKARMIELLLGEPFPELAAIAESGQKHIVFRAARNPAGSRAGWVQFEENQLWIEPTTLREWLDLVIGMLSVFAKSEIESGNYLPYRVIEYGIEQWQADVAIIKPRRGSLFLKLVIFLAQRKDKDIEDGSTEPEGSIPHACGGEPRGECNFSGHISYSPRVWG
jgi:hypothetical protein